MKPIQFHSKHAFNQRVEWVVAFILLFNSLSGYFIGQTMIDKISEPFLGSSFEWLLNLSYPIAIIISGLIGSKFLVKYPKIKLLKIWVLLGIASSLFTGIQTGSFYGTLGIIIFNGFSLGICMPTCFSFFTHATPIEKQPNKPGTFD